MKKFVSTLRIVLALMLSVFSSGVLPAATALAYSDSNPGDEFHKVYVCKYVGTPGVDESLQTGDNPISVDTHSLKNFVALGSFFNDEQGRSVAIAWDNEDGVEPPLSMCPAPSTAQGSLFAASNTCEELTVSATGILPVGASVEIKDNGATVQAGTYTASVGQHTLQLYVNGVLKDTKIVNVAECTVQPEGSVLAVSNACEKLTISISGITPAEASVVIKDNGDVVSTGTRTVTPGLHTIQLYVNDVLVDSTEVVVDECADGNVVAISGKCEQITITISAIKPAGATTTVKDNGVETTTGTHDVAAGSHTITLYVNGELVDSTTINVEACQQPCDHGCPPPPHEVKKVYVCKYVGTPGINERLKEGKNPISVSENSTELTNWNGEVESWFFRDAQNRSYVLGYTTDFETPPTRDDCPGNTNQKPDVQVLVAPCVDEGETTSITIRVFNPNDQAVTYKTKVAGSAAQIATIPADGQHDFTFSNYGVGVYKYWVYEKVAVTGTVEPTLSDTLITNSVPRDTYRWELVRKGTVTIAECQPEQPPVDVCPDVPGNQTNPDECGQTQGETDVCPNITGTQPTVPVGMIKDQQGNCVTDICPNLEGIQTSLPAGYTQVNGLCIAPVGGLGGQVLGVTTPEVLPATGSTNIPNPLLSIVAGFFAYLFLARKNRKAEA